MSEILEEMALGEIVDEGKPAKDRLGFIDIHIDSDGDPCSVSGMELIPSEYSDNHKIIGMAKYESLSGKYQVQVIVSEKKGNS